MGWRILHAQNQYFHTLDAVDSLEELLKLAKQQKIKLVISKNAAHTIKEQSLTDSTNEREN